MFRDVVGDQGQFGKDACEQLVQLVDAASGLSALGTECGHQITEFQKLGGGSGSVRRLFDNGEPGAGRTVDGIGLGLGVMGILVITIAFGFTDGEGDVEGELTDKRLKIGGILSSRIKADLEQDLVVVFGGQMLQGIVKLLITRPGFEEGEAAQGGGPILVGECDMVSIPGSVDADTDDDLGSGRELGHEWDPAERHRQRTGRESPREAFSVGNPRDERSTRMNMGAARCNHTSY